MARMGVSFALRGLARFGGVKVWLVWSLGPRVVPKTCLGAGGFLVTLAWPGLGLSMSGCKGGIALLAPIVVPHTARITVPRTRHPKISGPSPKFSLSGSAKGGALPGTFEIGIWSFWEVSTYKFGLGINGDLFEQ